MKRVRHFLFLGLMTVLALAIIAPLLPYRVSIPVPSWPNGYRIAEVPILDIANVLWDRAIIPPLTYFGKLSELFFTWPGAVILVSALMLWSGILVQIFPEFARRIQSLQFFGISLELNGQIKELRRETDDLSRLLPSVQMEAAKRLEEIVEKLNLRTAASRVVSQFVDNLIVHHPNLKTAKLRATFYIEDILFLGRLLQLFNYFNALGELLPGRTVGRAFSVRRGIIGRVWRSGLAEIAGVLPSDASTSLDSTKNIAQI